MMLIVYGRPMANGLLSAVEEQASKMNQHYILTIPNLMAKYV